MFRNVIMKRNVGLLRGWMLPVCRLLRTAPCAPAQCTAQAQQNAREIADFAFFPPRSTFSRTRPPPTDPQHHDNEDYKEDDNRDENEDDKEDDNKNDNKDDNEDDNKDANKDENKDDDNDNNLQQQFRSSQFLHSLVNAV